MAKKECQRLSYYGVWTSECNSLNLGKAVLAHLLSTFGNGRLKILILFIKIYILMKKNYQLSRPFCYGSFIIPIPDIDLGVLVYLFALEL